MPPIPPLPDLNKWKVCAHKVAKESKAWDGLTAGYKQWVERVHDHANGANNNWRRLLDFVRTYSGKLNWNAIMRSNVDGLVPADLAVLANDLYSFLGSVMTDAIHPRRQTIAGGEHGHGFEL